MDNLAQFPAKAEPKPELRLLDLPGEAILDILDQLWAGLEDLDHHELRGLIPEDAWNGNRLALERFQEDLLSALCGETGREILGASRLKLVYLLMRKGAEAKGVQVRG